MWILHKELLWNKGLIHLQYESNKELQNEKYLLRPKKKKKSPEESV